MLTVDNFSFFTYNWSFFAYNCSFFTYSWSFFAYSGKVRLIRALRDCKQRSLTVSKKALTVSKQFPALENLGAQFEAFVPLRVEFATGALLGKGRTRAIFP